MRTFLFLATLAGTIAIQQASAQSPQVSIDAPAGTSLLLSAKGDGAQIYTCMDSHWTLKAPDAKLIDAQGKVIGKHFAGPTWQLGEDDAVKGVVRGKAIAKQPAPDGASVPWLLVEAVSTGGSLSNVTYIRRAETHGGAAPKESCTTGEIRIPYTATYEFYTGGK